MSETMTKAGSNKELEKQSRLLRDLLERAQRCRARAQAAEEKRTKLSRGALASGLKIPKGCEALSSESQLAQREATDCDAAAEAVRSRIADLRAEIAETFRAEGRLKVREALEWRTKAVASMNAAVQAIFRGISGLDAADKDLAATLEALGGDRAPVITQKLKTGNAAVVHEFINNLFLPKALLAEPGAIERNHSEICAFALSC